MRSWPQPSARDRSTGEWKNDIGATVTKFDGYWRQADGKPLPYLDRLDFKIITEPRTG
jgi:ABC-type transport system substrate-binding protein